MERTVKWVDKYKDTANLILTFVGVTGALVGLSFLVLQTHYLGEQTQYLGKQTQLLSEQSQLLSEQYEATYRPYIAVEDIATQEGDNQSLRILINVTNYGQVPATKVDLQKVVIGGADVTYDEKAGTYTFTYTGHCSEGSPKTTITDNNTGVTVTACGIVIPLVEQDYPPDFVFFPGRQQAIAATVDESTYQATVSETKVMHIALEYSWGLKRYYYVAKASLQDGTWRVIQSRGN
jgi:hypothetical protein